MEAPARRKKHSRYGRWKADHRWDFGNLAARNCVAERVLRSQRIERGEAGRDDGPLLVRRTLAQTLSDRAAGDDTDPAFVSAAHDAFPICRVASQARTASTVCAGEETRQERLPVIVADVLEIICACASPPAMNSFDVETRYRFAVF
jgi:hypothetical protein